MSESCRLHRWCGFIALAWLLIAGCANWPGTGVNNSSLPPQLQQEGTHAGVVLTFDASSLQVTETLLESRLLSALPEGLLLPGDELALVGSTDITPEEGRITQTPDVHIVWDPLNVTIDGLLMDVTPTHFTITTALQWPVQSLTVRYDGKDICQLTMNNIDSALELHYELLHDGTGSWDVSVRDDMVLSTDSPLWWPDECPSDLTEELSRPEVQDAFTDTIAQHISPLVIPVVQDALPETLGIDIGMEVMMSFIDPLDHQGIVGWRVSPVTTISNTPWILSGERVIFPFEVSTHISAHPCVQSGPWATAPALQVPSPEGDAGSLILVNPEVIAQQITATWAAGAFCDDRITRDLAIDPSTLHAAWPQLTGLPPQSVLTSRLWPNTRPSFDIWSHEDQVPRFLITIDGWDLEIYARINDLEIRLASVSMAIEVGGHLMTDQSGQIQLVADDIKTDPSHWTNGRFSSPEASITQTLAEHIMAGFLDGRTIANLPPMPGAHEGISLQMKDDYLAILYIHTE